MKILDIFKKKKLPKKEISKKEIKERTEKIKAAEKPGIGRLEKKTVKPIEPVKPVKPSKKIASKERKFLNAYRILKAPHITEKATDLTKENKYIFKVWPKSNKIEIKKAIGKVYGVDVLSVNIIKVSPKKRRLGKTEGFRKGYKKAIVKIKQGQKIEVLPR